MSLHVHIMKASVKSTIKYIIVFFVTFVILASSLVAVALIPKDQIKPQAEESADFFCQHEMQTLTTDFVKGSQNDYFADCILLNIAYNLDQNHPLKSTMRAGFHGRYDFNAGYYLRSSIQNDWGPDHEYLRYWHGSIVPVRIMHLFWNIKQIYIFHAFLIGALILILVGLLAKNGFKAEGISFVLAMIIVGIWYVPRALEYTWMFLVMLVTSIIVVWMVTRGKTKHFGEIFLITGMVSVFLDFLTYETLTLLIPLLFIIRISEKNPLQERQTWGFSVKCCFLWLIGYAGMWASKWVMASIVLGNNVMPYVTGHITERAIGSVGISSTSHFLISAITLNLKRLFPYEYGISGAILVFACVLVFIVLPILLGRVRLKAHIDWQRISIYIGLGLVPFVRLLVMHNHAVIHCFFTYRAFASTILALCFIVLELVERNPEKMRKKDDERKTTVQIA